MNWPEALVAATAVAAVALVISVALWQIFKTGQTAIRKEHRRASDEFGRRGGSEVLSRPDEGARA
jgi:ABC-type nickel/cobalt efflux system permease component RcnA